MRQEQLDGLKKWFGRFVARFYGNDPYVNAHLKLKEEHTHRVCEEIVHLAQDLALDDNQKRVAELVGLFHDVGRFPQFAQYHTYNDRKCVDHCRLGVETLRGEGVLSVLSSEERNWVETAVEHHGRKCLPPDLIGQTLLFAKMIRDADKIDIFRIVIEKYKLFREDSSRFPFEIEFPDVPEYTPQVLEAVLNEQLVDYGWLRTLNDVRLCQLGWVYDVNFPCSLSTLRDRGYFDSLLDALPAGDGIDQVRRKIQDHIEDRIRQAGCS